MMFRSVPTTLLFGIWSNKSDANLENSDYTHPKKGTFQFCFPGLLGISVMRVGTDTFGDPIFQNGLQN